MKAKEVFYHRENDCVPIGSWQTTDKVQGNMRPWTVRDRWWLQEFGRSLMRGFVLTANSTGLYNVSGVLIWCGSRNVPQENFLSAGNEDDR